MAAIIDLQKEFPSENISVSPYWVLGIIRLKYPVTYSRKNAKSISVIAGDGASLRGDNLVLTDECIAMNIQRSKGSHIKTLSATLKRTGKELLTEILPGDWVFAWIVNDEDTGKKLVERIKNSEACNGKEDGLKFIGRVGNISKSVDKTNTHSVTYGLSAYGFREMETLMFYDQMLAQIDLLGSNVASWMIKLGMDYDKLFKPLINSMFEDNVMYVLQSHIELILGKGAPDDGVNPVGPPELNATHGQTTGAPESPPFSYVVPAEVGQWIFRAARNGSGKFMAYADTLDLLMGVQEYSGNSSYPKIDSTDGNLKRTGKPLVGAIMPVQAVSFNRPLWSLLQQFSNPALNEIYTCLKLNENGRIMPTFVARQKPFTTDALSQDNNNSDTFGPAGVDSSANLPTTKFSDLPRWKIYPYMVDSYSIGRGEAARCNLVKVTGAAQHVAVGITPTQQIIDNPPPSDDIDIQRSGIYSYTQVADVTEGSTIGTIPGKMMRIVADWSMGNHLALQGTMDTIGIQSAICEGDNIEYCGMIFHIEALEFHCSISSNRKTFRTRLNLANGMEEGTTTLSGGDGDIPNYPGVPGNQGDLVEGGLEGTTEQNLPGFSSSFDKVDKS